MKKHTYSHQINTYVEEFLQNNIEKTVIKVFKQKEKYKSGIYYGYIPDNLPEEYRYSFEHSLEKFYSDSDFKDIIEFAVEFIMKHLHSDTNAICISHGGSSSSTDPWIEKYYKDDYPLLSYKEELYFLLRNDQNTKKKVTDFVYRSQNHWPQQIILCTYSKELNKINDRMYELSPSQIEDISEQANKMLINVQDLKGYIFWENKK